jgi:hypothetical protein
LIVTDIVLAPVEDATRYQTSASMLFLRVLVALVNAAPFHDADAIEPIPATFWAMSAVRTITGLVPLTVCVHVFVVVPLVVVVMLVEVASNAIVEVETPPPEVVDAAVVSTVATRSPLAKTFFVVVAPEAL